MTDEAAKVTHLASEHPVLTAPNPIGPEDWADWDKERGLYFASGWDDAYLPPPLDVRSRRGAAGGRAPGGRDRRGGGTCTAR